MPFPCQLDPSPQRRQPSKPSAPASASAADAAAPTAPRSSSATTSRTTRTSNPPAQRERSRTWFDGLLLKAGTKRTNIVHLATALHRDAIGPVAHEHARLDVAALSSHRSLARPHGPLARVGRDLRQHGSRRSRRAMPARFTTRTAKRWTHGAEVLWPEEEDLYTLMCMRVEGGRTAFEREKQNVPINPELCEWPEEYFDRPIWFDAWPTRPAIRVIALDPSKGGRRARRRRLGFRALGRRSHAASCTSKPTSPAAPRRRSSPTASSSAAASRPTCSAIEANQFQELFAGEFARRLRRARTARNAASSQSKTRPTSSSASAGSVRCLSAGRLRFKSHSRGTQLLVDQLREFPLGDHDDGPDALEMAVRLADAWLSRTKHFDDGLGNRLRLSSSNETTEIRENRRCIANEKISAIAISALISSPCLRTSVINQTPKDYHDLTHHLHTHSAKPTPISTAQLHRPLEPFCDDGEHWLPLGGDGDALSSLNGAGRSSAVRSPSCRFATSATSAACWPPPTSSPSTATKTASASSSAPATPTARRAGGVACRTRLQVG